jgi:glycosyltransferase involved in cell wall biosynthesis
VRIAYLYDCVYPYQIGGIERRVWELSKRLSERGHEVHLFGMQFWDEKSVLEKDGVFLHGVCPARVLYSGGRRKVAPAVSYACRLFAPLLFEKFDLIDAQAFPYLHCFPAKVSSVIRKTPLVITWHEVWGEYWYRYLGRWGFIGRSIEWGVSRLSRNIIAVSPSTARDLLSLGLGNGITVIPNGIDCRHIGTIPPASLVSDIIFAGRFIPEKNVDMVIAAVDILRREIPDIRAVIVGDGPQKDSLHTKVHDRGLEKHVTFTGFLDNPDSVISLMKASKVFVFPSVREGFGMAALEAMACGLPVVTVDHPGNATTDLVTPETGIITSLSPESLADAVRTCLQDHGRFRDACRAKAGGSDWESVVDQAERYYASVMG